MPGKWPSPPVRLYEVDADPQMLRFINELGLAPDT